MGALIRCGDIVLHGPSGEEWSVAYANYETGDMSWRGWPEGVARIDDCTLIRAASEEEHERAVWEVAQSATARAGVVKRLYTDVVARMPPRQEAPFGEDHGRALPFASPAVPGCGRAK